jgi:hypothetical protein
MSVRVPPGSEHYRPEKHLEWWLTDGRWRDAAIRVSRLISDPSSIPAGQLLKTDTRRLVFTLPLADGSDCVVKAFPLRGLRTRLKHWKYAPSEAWNLSEAAERGLPVPELYGWGARRELGLVRWNAVLMQRVEGRTFAEILEEAEDDGQRAVWVERSIALFRQIYRAGCNHIDLKPEALIFGEEPDSDRIIDFQYCTFAAESDIDTFMAQAGHFVHWWEKSEAPAPALVDAWFEALLAAVEVPLACQDEARGIFESHRRTVRSIADRLQQ